MVANRHSRLNVDIRPRFSKFTLEFAKTRWGDRRYKIVLAANKVGLPTYPHCLGRKQDRFAHDPKLFRPPAEKSPGAASLSTGFFRGIKSSASLRLASVGLQAGSLHYLGHRFRRSMHWLQF